MALHHVEINVTDLAKSKEFWRCLLCDWFGYHVYQEWPKGISFKQSQTYLVFIQADPVYVVAGYLRRRTGLNHLAFYAPSREFIDQLSQEIFMKKIKILYGSPLTNDGNYSLFFEDSDRIKIEIVYSNQNQD